MNLTINNLPSYTLSVAPMMDWTDRHFRYFIRLITKKTLLYTEMVTTGAILNGNKQKLLDFSREELPLALQLGGDDPSQLAECSKIGEDFGYSEINLNVGCPSERVQNGNFGACLMATPDLVAKCLEKMKSATSIPITVKHRIGIDGLESYENLSNFIKIVKESGVDRFIVHARIAILKGLSPAENRKVPPLRYEDVYKLKQDFPDTIIEINGGILTLDDTITHLQKVDGVMIGRAAYDNPYLFIEADEKIFGEQKNTKTRQEIANEFLPYLESHIQNGGRIHQVLRHILGFCNGIPGAKKYRRYLSENMYGENIGAEVFLKALEQVV
ncbi:MAG: tRNA dihydrouridine(20/20a) synthase DusA [Leptospiraceae bacterium]|nr:tRNA dihydrouridine(20/20a) synthase DusA [Leptospiraceae bacterium]